MMVEPGGVPPAHAMPEGEEQEEEEEEDEEEGASEVSVGGTELEAHPDEEDEVSDSAQG